MWLIMEQEFHIKGTAMIQECERLYKYLLAYHMVKLEKKAVFLAIQSFWSGLEALISGLGIGKKHLEFDFALNCW